MSVEYFNQLLGAARQVHVVYLAQLLGAVLFIHIISNHDTLISIHDTIPFLANSLNKAAEKKFGWKAVL